MTRRPRTCPHLAMTRSQNRQRRVQQLGQWEVWLLLQWVEHSSDKPRRRRRSWKITGREMASRLWRVKAQTV